MDDIYECKGCCECVLKRILAHFGKEMSAQTKELCACLGNGLGVGTICGAVLASLMAAGILCGDDAEKAQICILDDFSQRFKSLDCACLEPFKDCDGCSSITEETIKSAEKYISLFYHGSF